MPQTFRYLHYDVFTRECFHGNQLAVLPDARGLTSHQMQQVAAEMAFSETTFVLPAEDDACDARMRIFTPRTELPMAGHPTVGSAFALAHEGAIEAGRREFVFALGVGPTPVELEWKGDVLSFVWMTQPLPEFRQSFTDRAALAAVLGLHAEDVSANPAQVVSSGVPLLFIALNDSAAVDRATLGRPALRQLLAAVDLEELPVFVFALSGKNPQATVHSRMFAPTFGIEEDPATGGASGPLGGYLLHHSLLSAEPETRLVSNQGVSMGRPSRIHVALETEGGVARRVRVGGEAVLVAEGTLRL